MHLTEIDIENIRGFSTVEWRITAEHAAGWHVILGDNGSGKTTFIRSVALALIGPQEAIALRQNWNTWLRRDSKRGTIAVQLTSHHDYDRFTGSGRGVLYDKVALQLERRAQEVVLETYRFPKHEGRKLDRHIWGSGSGWFSASYGPYRRFSGGDKDYEKIFYSNPKLARHLSAFGESVALTESLRWLQELKYKELEGGSDGQLLAKIMNFVNATEFLPHQAKIYSVSSEGVIFIDGDECILPVEELSDGYRSILSMTFELIRQLASTYGHDRLFEAKDPTKIKTPGVVLIDEIDAHLHPIWQRRVGLWFRQRFPNLQFIVTTHSPLVCQAASVGTIYRLPTPGTEEQGEMLTGIDFNRLVYGDILDAYSTEAFGTDVTRSEESKQRLQRLALLNRRAMSNGLSPEETAEQLELRAMLPTAANTPN